MNVWSDALNGHPRRSSRGPSTASGMWRKPEEAPDSSSAFLCSVWGLDGSLYTPWMLARSRRTGPLDAAGLRFYPA